VAAFDTASLAWSDWPALDQGRAGHACARLGDTVVIAGGYGEDRAALASTTLLSIASREAREGGAMAAPRAYFGLAELKVCKDKWRHF
jgi:hypothetical protein